MPLILKSYCYCVIGACIYVVLITLVAKPFLNVDKDYDRWYHLWDDAPVLYKIAAVFTPVINLAFALMALSIIGIKVRWWWYDLGRFVVYRFTKGKVLKHFRIKEFIVRIFFRFYIDTFYKRFENDTIDKIFKGLHDKNEK